MTRHKPWRPDNPDAIIVARPSKFGNPFRINGSTWPYERCTQVRDRTHAVRLYRLHLREHPELEAAARHELAGTDLACWCPLPGPGEYDHCHAALLIQAANGIPDFFGRTDTP